MSKLSVEIKGDNWTTTYLSLNTDIHTAFINAIRNTKYGIKRVIIEVESQNEVDNARVF